MMRLQSLTLMILVILNFSIVQAEKVELFWNGSNALVMPRENPVIESNLNAEVSARSQADIVAVWVFFTDKGLENQESYRRALGDFELKMTAANRERRTKTRGNENLADFRDLPVADGYISEVLATGPKRRQTLRWFNAVSIEATRDQINEIAKMPFVRYIKEIASCRITHDVTLSPIPAIPELTTLDYGSSATQINQINVVPAHEIGFKGQGIIVCMMDVGFKQEHDAFQPIINSGRLLAQYDFINHDNNTDYDPSQDSPSQADHGTLTWSTLGGEAPGNLFGPSYMASFILAKTEDVSSERHIEEDNWAAGAEWADSIGASVISSSLGYRYFDSGQGDYSYQDLNGHTAIVTQAAQWAAFNGITVCNAMGNDGYDGPGSLIAPADADSILSCGAVDGGGTLAGFSSRGPTFDGRIKPEVCAQGSNTVCADPYNMNGYTYASGTSLSTPLVGGASGVILSAHSNWTPIMVRDALMMTADRFDAPDNDYGHGIMDVSRALYYHPQGDIIIDHKPSIFVGLNQPLVINATITGGAGIVGAHLFYKTVDIGEYNEVPMTSSDNVNFTSQIPGATSQSIYYYIKAVDNNGAYAYDPITRDTHPYKVTPGSTSFTDSYEGGISYWKSGGTNNLWGLSASNAHSGNLSITDSPTTNYRNGTSSFLESAFRLDLSGVSAANFSFYWKGTLQSGHDSVFVEASTNGGTSWARFTPALTGVNSNFVLFNANLSSYLGNSDVALRFHLVTDVSGNDNGIFIDDISITEVRPAKILFTPTSIIDTIESGQSHIKNLTIMNTGNANLMISLQAIELNMLSETSNNDGPPHILNSWLFISPASDTITSGDNLVASVTLDAGSLAAGNYSGQLSIISNDPDSPLSTIPVSLRVGELCQYTPGDVNGNGMANGIDIVYAVNYLKGNGPNPPNVCDCPPHGQVFVAGDANGNCIFNGVDITYFVRFLKAEIPALLNCPDCPPTAR